MTIPVLLLPLLVAITLAIAVTTVHRRLPPVLAARAVTVTLVAIATAAVPTVWILALGYLAHDPLLGKGLRWCAETFGVHQRVPAWVGIPALAIGLAGSIRAGKVLRTHRRLRLDLPGSIEIADHEQAFAVTLPGRGGRVVLSTALVELLDEQGQAVVVAHESAHALHRHDRYLLIAQVASATVPLLRPLTSRLQFSLERWADEAAVADCGDRQLVARTLAAVALHRFAPAGTALSFTGLGVPARVAALLAAPPRPPRWSVQVGLWLAIGFTGAFAAYQLHHLAGLISSLCPD